MKQLFYISVCFLIVSVTPAVAQGFLRGTAGGADRGTNTQKPKQQIYKCGDNWSYVPCPPEPKAPIVVAPNEPDPIIDEVRSNEEELERIRLVERLYGKIDSVEKAYNVVPNHAYKIEWLCKNPAISLATCERLISELDASMKSYDRDQAIAELERREAREMNEKKRLAIRTEKLLLIRRKLQDNKDSSKDIEKF